MAKIQLDQEVLDVEELIDNRSHDEAFRQLILLRDRFGRRPEYRYLKALFDVTFETRTDVELLEDVRALVGEQPDFLEAVSLLAFLLNRTGDTDRAMVFAREAAHSSNQLARKRAAGVLGDIPSMPTADEEPFARRSSASIVAVQDDPGTGAPHVIPPMAATPEMGMRATPRETREMFTPHPAALRSSTSQPAFDPFRIPSTPPPLEDDSQALGRTLEGLPHPPAALLIGSSEIGSSEIGSSAKRMSTMPPPPDPVAGPSLQKPSTLPPPYSPSEPPGAIGSASPVDGAEPWLSEETSGVMRSVELGSQPPTRDARALAAEIPFSPTDTPMPPPPTIPPDAFDMATSETPTAVGRSSPAGIQRPSEWARSERATDRPPGPTGLTPTPLPPRYAVERTGIERKRTTARPGIAIPEPPRQVRSWFQYARDNQLQLAPDGGFSTARTLLDLAERVVEGATPLSTEPMPLDRRGLILVEERLVPMRGRSGTQPAAERGAVTAAAAFLLGLLLKECDGKAVDTSAEDGACKVVVPSGATVRPLLVAAAFARSRGPGLVETFDRAATAHMRRGPARRTQPNHSEPPRKAQQDFELTVLRRDLDASTLGVTDPETPPAPQPRIDLQRVAVEFWESELGRDLIGSSRRIGTFTIADVDALERHASKTYSAVGFAPPGTPWPWAPTEQFEELVLCWGAVLGEVLVGLYAGRWEADPGNPDDSHLFRVVLSGGVVAWPVAKAYMRFARGIPHDLSVYVDAVGRVVGRQALGGQSWPKS